MDTGVSSSFRRQHGERKAPETVGGRGGLSSVSHTYVGLAALLPQDAPSTWVFVIQGALELPEVSEL